MHVHSSWTRTLCTLPGLVYLLLALKVCTSVPSLIIIGEVYRHMDKHLLYNYSAAFESVLEYLTDIIELLKTTDGARNRLTDLYVKNKWLNGGQTPTENQLVQQALARIKLDDGTDQFHKFLTMLRATGGLTVIADKIESNFLAYSEN